MATARATSETADKYDDLWDEFLADLENNPTGRVVDSDPNKTNGADQQKRAKSAGPGDLGLDKEINLKKKPRAPRVKLDETRYAGCLTGSCIHPTSETVNRVLT
jgi:hypothetical protein